MENAADQSRQGKLPFVNRRFRIACGAGVTRELVLTLYSPVEDDHGDWSCTHNIQGPTWTEESEGCAYGSDGVQALLLSLQMAEARVQSYTRSIAGTLSWFEDE